MRRLTISGTACVETLTALVALAWADGQLEDREKAGVRGAVEVLNLTKEMRERLEKTLAAPAEVDQILVESLTPRDRAFTYVAAAWMCGADDEVHEKEEAALDQLARHLGIDAVRKAELERIAREIEPILPGTTRKWSDEVVRLFKSIPPRLEPTPAAPGEEIEVSFE
jgi:uncharacterized membrane protein YebE (DUF533 family)